jgi:drug/metabolite transporter (DMT)-like permease
MVFILLYLKVIKGKKILFKVDGQTLIFLLLSGIVLTLYNHLFFRGLETGLPGAGGVLVTTTNPLFTYLLWLVFFKKQIRAGAVAGLIIGFSGGFILLKVWILHAEDLFQSGNLYFIFASIIFGVLTILSQQAQKKIDFIMYSFYLYAFSSIFGLIFALPRGLEVVLSQGPEFWLPLVYVGIPAIAFASTVYFYASSKLGSHHASAFIFLVPVSALSSSYLIFQEKPEWTTLVGGVLALGAIYLINKFRET